MYPNLNSKNNIVSIGRFPPLILSRELSLGVWSQVLSGVPLFLSLVLSKVLSYFLPMVIPRDREPLTRTGVPFPNTGQGVNTLLPPVRIAGTSPPSPLSPSPLDRIASDVMVQAVSLLCSCRRNFLFLNYFHWKFHKILRYPQISKCITVIKYTLNSHKDEV